MASDVGIVNAALLKLGQRPIISLTENSPGGRIAGATYADLRDDLLREHPWNFATVYVQVPAGTNTPAWGFARAFPFPQTPYCLRILLTDNWCEWPYKIVGREIYTDLSSPLSISYIKQVTDANEMDATFRDALSAKLALEWCEKLCASSGLTQQLMVLYREKLRLARSFNGQEDGAESLARYSWIESRF